MRSHSPVQIGAPANVVVDQLARISPLVSGRHYCETDWHGVVLGLIDGNLAGESATPSQIRARLLNDDVSFYLQVLPDGMNAPIDTTRTPVQRYLASLTDFTDGYYVNSGQIFGPSELPPRSYKLTAQIIWSGDGTPDVLSSDFTIDAAGSGVCLGDAFTFKTP